MRRALVLFLVGCASAPPAAAPAAAPAPAPAPRPAPTVVPEPQYMTAAPKLPAAKTWEAPPPASWKLKNGLEVVLVEKHTAPLVGMVLVVKTGSDADPPKKLGTASLATDMLDEGAGKKSALELAEAIEHLGAHLFTSADVEGCTVGMSVLSSRLDEASRLFADVVLRPNFDPKDFDRVKGEHVARLLQRRVEPRSMAQLAMMASLYGDTAYGRPTTGYLDTVQPLTVADARRYYDTWFHPGNAVLVVVGDVTRDDLEKRANDLFGAWKARPTRPPKPPVPPKTRPRVVLVDKPGAPQSVVRIAEPAIPRASADYAALETLMTVLGGSFTSRLERNLRERNNFTYGAGAGVEWLRGPGPLVARADVFTDVTAPALVEFMKELEGIHTPVSTEELGKAKALQRQNLVQQMQSDFLLSAILANLLDSGLSADDYRKLDAELTKLTPADLARAADRYVHPKYATIVVVGDLAKIRGPIEKLGLGSIELRDAEGKRL